MKVIFNLFKSRRITILQDKQKKKCVMFFLTFQKQMPVKKKIKTTGKKQCRALVSLNQTKSKTQKLNFYN